jgi:hypothetical protein
MSEAQALCARHPGTEATFTCTRCGSFGCAQCLTPSSAALCLPCEAAQFPATLRGGLELPSLLTSTFQQVGEHFRGLGVIVVAWSLINWLYWDFLESPLMVSFQENPEDPSLRWLLFRVAVNGSMALLLGASTIRWMADGILGRSPHSLGAALLAAPANFPRLALMGALYTLGICLGLVSCVFPGIFLAACWSLAPAALMVDRHSPIRALRHSFELTYERRWTVIPLFLLQMGLEGAIQGLQSWALNLPWLSEPAYFTLSFAVSLAFGIAIATFDTLYVIFYLRLTRGLAPSGGGPTPLPAPLPLAQ